MATCKICGKEILNAPQLRICNDKACREIAREETTRRAKEKKKREKREKEVANFEDYNSYIKKYGHISYGEYQTLKRENKI